MTESLRPETDNQVLDAIRWAAAENRPLEVIGSASKSALGRPSAAATRLDTSANAGIVLYEPEELVLTARAGTPMAEIEAALAQKNQHLWFEPPYLSPLLNDRGEENNTGFNGTLGGVIACNLSGPRRVMVGAARDHLLGFHAVSGRGEVFKSGGRVVKNVTGFDLSKLITGSFGTLAVMTEVTVRALPASEETRTVLVIGCEEECATRSMATALQSPYEVSGAAHLPPDIGLRSSVARVSEAGGPVTALRVEGPGPSVVYRANALATALSSFGELAELDDYHSRVLWREIRDVSFFVDQGDRQIWRLSVPPSDGARIAADLLFEIDGCVYFDWGGGLLWLSLVPASDAHHQRIRAAIAGTGGHATLIRASVDVRASVPVFQPQPPALAALTQRIKDGFDPNGILNPGRMYEEV
ncbi:MAG: glycolate oxidase subunit GlcE [Rhodospirillales bacterium]|nr:glycolate oxidase subunit GlcE [Rhodospirillales bacterium]